MLRFAARCSLVMLSIALMACGSGDVDVDPDVAKGCKALCDAQAKCAAADDGDTPCTDACAAEVGTPGSECGKALEALAACVKAGCEDTCTAEKDAQANACGGTG